MGALSGFLSDVRAVWGLSLLLKLLSDVCVLGCDPLMGMHVCVCVLTQPHRETPWDDLRMDVRGSFPNSESAETLGMG